MRRESWRRGVRPHEHGQSVGARPARALRIVMPLAVSLALALVWAIAATTVSQAPAAHAASNAQVMILTPVVGSDNSAQGPVGANVTIQASGLTPQTSYTVGVAIAPQGCVSQFINATNQPVSADANGSFTTTFLWPKDAAAVGSSYYICVQDATQPVSIALQSLQVYIVRAANAPLIDVKPAPQSSGGAGTPTTGPIPPQGSNRFYAGEQVTITGQNFVPGGQNLSAYLTTQKITDASQLQSATALQTLDGSAIVPDNNGSFSTTVVLTQNASPGKYYVYIVSQDTQSGALPSLMAEKSITIIPQPTPTPTVTVAPTPTSTPGGAGTSTTGSNSPSNLGAIIGLGVTSALLFIIGVILLASAAAMPRAQR